VRTPGLRQALVLSAIAILGGGVALVVTRRLPAPPPAKAAESARHLPVWTAAEKRAIDDAVASATSGATRLALRPAVDADATDSDEHRDLEAVYGGYHPFFARGDLDGDGRLDFVQAFLEKGRSGAWFHVAVFFGRADGSFDKPVWVEKSISLADGDVTVERSLVIVTPDLASESARRWRWEPGERVFVDPDAEPRPAGTSDDDAPEETPEQKPRARI
jgi:hypothetical protein